MADFFQTLLRPDREEDPERAEVTKVANLLQISEFELLQLAYYAWHGEDMPEAASDGIFRAYMLHSQVPAWARHYVRRVYELDEAGEFQRYDTGPDLPEGWEPPVDSGEEGQDLPLFAPDVPMMSGDEPVTSEPVEQTVRDPEQEPPPGERI